MDNSLSDIFSTSDIFDSSNITTNDEYEHLRVIFEEVLCTVSFIDVEENIFKDEVPKLKQAFIEVTESIHQNLKDILSKNELIEDLKRLIQKYISLLSFTHNAVKYITNKVPFPQVESLPLAVGEILLITFKHCKESDKLYGKFFAMLSYLLTDLFKKTNELQISFFNLLNNHLVFDLTDENQIIFLVRVVEILSTIGEIVSGLDIKTTADLWKAYIVLSQKYNECLKTRVNIEPQVKYLSSEIVTMMESIENIGDMKNVEKTLKISSFNLKIVIKLCGMYDYFGESIVSLFDLLIILNRYSIPYLHYQRRLPKFIDLMQVYVIAASEPLLKCLVSNREFIQHYFKNIESYFEDENKRLPAIFLSISVLKMILTSDLDLHEWISIDYSYNLIFILLSSLHQFHVEFSINLPIQTTNGESRRVISLYELMLSHLASVILSFKSKQFNSVQKLLFKSLLQVDPWKAMIASDIWCIIARYGSAEFCFNQLVFLINVFLKLEKHDRLEVKYLNQLISRLYSLLSNKDKTNFINRYQIEKFIKIWSVIGINKEPLLTNKINALMEELNKKIDMFLTNNSNVENFQLMCDLMDLLSTYSFVKSDSYTENLTNRITKLWSLNIDLELQEQVWLVKFIRNLSKITSSLMICCNSQNLLKILQYLINISGSNLQIKLPKCMILKSLATKQIDETLGQKQIFNSISTLFSTLLKDRNPLIKQRVLEVVLYFANHTPHQQIFANIVDDDAKRQEILNFLQRIPEKSNVPRIDYLKSQRNVKHKCYEIKSEEPLQKKKKMTADTNAPIIIQRLKFDCDSLVEFYKTENMTEEAEEDLTIVTTKLQTLLKSRLSNNKQF